MCCCGKPTINGQPGAYSWDGQTFSTRQPWAPELMGGDSLLWDEPGRCGGIDAHSHHFRLVKGYGGTLSILVQHGGGRERVNLGSGVRALILHLDTLDSDGRYWLLHTLYSAHCDGADRAREETSAYWRQAAADKRIKTRKVRGGVRVSVEPAPRAEAT